MHEKEITYKESGTYEYAKGSFGNGAVVRIAPVGLMYRNSTNEALRQAVYNACMCTHVHPDALDAAFIQAKAVALLCTNQVLSASDLIVQLLPLVQTETLRKAMAKIPQAIQDNISDEQSIDMFVTPNIFGTGFQIRAIDALVHALFIFCKYGDMNPELALVKMCSLGGDADSVGAILGALLGAKHGTAWIPHRWFDTIENFENGRDDIIALAHSLSCLQEHSFSNFNSVMQHVHSFFPAHTS